MNIHFRSTFKYESNTDPVKPPILVVDKKYIPEVDAKSITEINYSVQRLMLRGHTFFIIDLQIQIPLEFLFLEDFKCYFIINSY